MKVIALIVLLAINVNCDKLIDTTTTTKLNIKTTNKLNKEKDTSEIDNKEVHKRGIFHNEHGLANFAQANTFAFWPKSYASHYGYGLRPVGLLKPKPIFATPTFAAASPLPAVPYVLRPGGAAVSSYSVTYPRSHVRPAYSVQPLLPAAAPVQPVQQIVPALPPVVQQPVLPVQSVSPPHQQHFFQNTFVPQAPPTATAPVFSAPSAWPEFPTFSFAPEPQVPQIPQIPEIPQIPQIPQLPQVPESPQFNAIFPLHIQPPNAQQPPSFGNFPHGGDFANFLPVGNVQPVDSGSAIASPQIPAPPATPAALPEPEQPTAQAPPTQSQTPWKPLFTQRPSHTLQPPYGTISPGYLPPAAPQAQQQYYDNISDAELEQLFQQAKYVPHHSQHLHRHAAVYHRHNL